MPATFSSNQHDSMNDIFQRCNFFLKGHTHRKGEEEGMGSGGSPPPLSFFCGGGGVDFIQFLYYVLG